MYIIDSRILTGMYTGALGIPLPSWPLCLCMYVQPVPEKMRLEMVIGMEIGILHGQGFFLQISPLKREVWWSFRILISIAMTISSKKKIRVSSFRERAVPVCVGACLLGVCCLSASLSLAAVPAHTSTSTSTPHIFPHSKCLCLHEHLFTSMHMHTLYCVHKIMSMEPWHTQWVFSILRYRAAHRMPRPDSGNRRPYRFQRHHVWNEEYSCGPSQLQRGKGGVGGCTDTGETFVYVW